MAALRELKSFCTLPLVLPNEVVTVPGYHAETQTYASFDPEVMESFSLNPSRAELIAALKQIWRPFEGYKFSSPADRGALLAAIMGIFSRAGMELAPGVLIDAPCPGSGKTILGQAIGALILGRRAPVTPFASVDDVELKKILVANAIQGYEFLLLDNVVGVYDSAVMASILTTGALRDRVLCSSTMFDGFVRLNVFLTSNNASLSRDLTSRFIRVRIDSGVEQPQGLSFKFCPIERALTERMAIVRAVCTVFQGFFAAGSPHLGKGDARFPEWSRLVRQCVLWCDRSTLTEEGRQRLNEGEEPLLPEHGLPSLAEEAGLDCLGDPAWHILECAGKTDSESEGLALLLDGLRSIFGGECFYAREVMKIVESAGTFGSNDIKEALEILLPARGHLNAHTVGSVLRYRVDRIADGLVLRKRTGEKKTTLYSVQRA